MMGEQARCRAFAAAMQRYVPFRLVHVFRMRIRSEANDTSLKPHEDSRLTQSQMQIEWRSEYTKRFVCLHGALFHCQSGRFDYTSSNWRAWVRTPDMIDLDDMAVLHTPAANIAAASMRHVSKLRAVCSPALWKATRVARVWAVSKVSTLMGYAES